MNKCIFIGRSTRDVELHEVASEEGKTITIARTGLALTRQFSKKNPKEADFVNLVAFGKNAEVMSKYFGKQGSYMIVTAHVQSGSYNKDGQKRYTTDFVVEQLEFGPKTETSTQAPQTHAQNTGNAFQNVDEGLPQAPQTHAQNTGNAFQNVDEGLPDGFGSIEDDLPWN